MTEPPEYPPPSPYPSEPQPPAAPPAPPYGQQPLPQYGQQPWQGSGPVPPAYQQPPSGTNGFAIASLVFGILGGFCFLGIIFGIIALVKIGRTGQKGRGLAIAGIVLTGVWIVIGIVLAVSGAFDEAERDKNGTITKGGDVRSTELKVGDCVNELRAAGEVKTVPAVPCSDPHRGEVYAVVKLPGTEYPSTTQLDRMSGTRCSAQLKKVSPAAFKDRKVQIYYLYPLEISWTRGDHEVTCLAATQETRTGSIAD